MISIIGLGLIGGSLGLELKGLFPSETIIGIDLNEYHQQVALKLRLVHQIGTIDDVSKSDLVFVCVPVDVIVKILPKILDSINLNTVVIDFGSTKNAICKVVNNHPKRHQFVACHPIAGTEFSGPKAAQKKLFEHKTMIVCDIEHSADFAKNRAITLFEQLNMNISYMNSKDHDLHIAYVSHLSHISSFMLGKTVIEKEKNHQNIFDMAGSGFASTVRLAKSSPDMWLPIFKQNKIQVLKALADYIEQLEHFRHLLQIDNDEAVYLEMKNTNRIKEIIP